MFGVKYATDGGGGGGGALFDQISILLTYSRSEGGEEEGEEGRMEEEEVRQGKREVGLIPIEPIRD